VDRIELSLSLDMRGAAKTAAVRPGLAYQLFEGVWDRLPDFARRTPVTSGRIGDFDVAAIAGARTQYAVRFNGFIEVPADGVYTFHTMVTTGRTCTSATNWLWITTASTTASAMSRGESSGRSR
jgi:hypothetical protein